jgi:hypothetical protein
VWAVVRGAAELGVERESAEALARFARPAFLPAET